MKEEAAGSGGENQQCHERGCTGLQGPSLGPGATASFELMGFPPCCLFAPTAPSVSLLSVMVFPVFCARSKDVQSQPLLSGSDCSRNVAGNQLYPLSLCSGLVLEERGWCLMR